MSYSPVDQLAISPDAEIRSSGEDRLQFSPIARSICREIERWKRLHHGVTIGIYGSWGSGKTSLMRLLQSMLEGKDQPPTNSTAPDAPVEQPPASDRSSDQNFSPTRQYLTIWFSAWHYDKRDDVWIALLRVILREIAGRLARRQRVSLYWKLWWGRIDWPIIIGCIIAFLVFLVLLSILTAGSQPSGETTSSAFGFSVKDAAAVLSLVILVLGILQYVIRSIFAIVGGKLGVNLRGLTRKSPEDDYAIFVDDVHSSFQRLLCTIGREFTVVVFIDDLDRCSSDQVVPILEAVKQFTESREAGQCQPKNNAPDKPQIVFVIGADREAIKHAVESRYKQASSIDAARKQQSDILQDMGKVYLEKIVQISIDLPHLGSGGVRGYVTGLLGDAAQSSLFVPEVVEFFIEVLPDNPRLIKRVLNTYMLMRRIVLAGPHQASTTPEKDNPWRLLPLLITIRYLFEPAFQQLWSYPNLLEDLLKIAAEQYDGLEEVANLGCPTEQPGTALVEQYGLHRPELLTVLRAFQRKFLPPNAETRIDPEEVLNVLRLDLTTQPAATINTTASILSGDPTRIARAHEVDSDGAKLWAGRLLNLFGAADSALRERAMFTFARIASAETADFNTAVELLSMTVLTEHSDKDLRAVERALYALIRLRSPRAQEIILQFVARAANDLSLRTLALRGLKDLPKSELADTIKTDLVSLYSQGDNPAIAGEAKKLIQTHLLTDAVATALANATEANVVGKILDLLIEWRQPLEEDSSVQLIIPRLANLIVEDIMTEKATIILQKPTKDDVLRVKSAELIFVVYVDTQAPQRARLLKPLAQAADAQALPLLRRALEKHPEDLLEILGALGYVGATPTLDRVDLLWALAQARRQQRGNDEQLSTDTAFLDIQRQLENIKQNAVLPQDVRELAGKYADEIDAWLKTSGGAPAH